MLPPTQQGVQLGYHLSIHHTKRRKEYGIGCLSEVKVIVTITTREDEKKLLEKNGDDSTCSQSREFGL